MLDHSTETFMAVCSVMNYRRRQSCYILPSRQSPSISSFWERIRLPPFSLWKQKTDQDPAAQMLEDYLRSVQQRENFLREKIKQCLRELRIGAPRPRWLCDHRQIHDFLNQPDTALTLIVDNSKASLHLLEQNTLDYAIMKILWQNRFKASYIAGNLCESVRRIILAGREVSVEERFWKQTSSIAKTALNSAILGFRQ